MTEKKLSVEGISIRLGGYLEHYNQGWISIPRAVIRTKMLTDPEFRTWSVLYSYTGHKGTFPSMIEISEVLGVSYSKVRKNMKQLEDKGFIERERRGFSDSYDYILLIPKEVMDEYQAKIDKEEPFELSKENEFLIQKIGEVLGRGFAIGVREIAILKAAKELIDDQHITDYLIHAKKDLQKAIIVYIKKFGQVPSKERILEFDYYIEDEGIAILLEAIRKAQKTNTKIHENIEEGKQRVAQKKEFMNKKYESPTKAKTEEKTNPYQKEFKSIFDK